MLSNWRRLVFDTVPYTKQLYSCLERTMARYSIRGVSLPPPHFTCATTRMRLRASLHRIFRALMCFLKERCEPHHSPMNFADSSTSRNVCILYFVVIILAGLSRFMSYIHPMFTRICLLVLEQSYASIISMKAKKSTLLPSTTIQWKPYICFKFLVGTVLQGMRPVVLTPSNACWCPRVLHMYF